MKKILIAISLVLFLLLAGLLSLPYWFDVNNYKDQIVAAIKDKTGISVQIKGKIVARALPDLSLTLNDVSMLSSFEEGGNAFSADNLILKVKLSPLLHKKLEIDSLKLVKPVVNLHVKPNGDANWEAVSHGSDKMEKVEDEVTELSYVNPDVERGYMYNNFTLNDLTIKDGSFRFLDEKNGKDFSVRNINVSTSVKPGDNNFSLSGKVDVFDNKEKGKFSFDGRYFIGSDKYNIDDVTIKLDGIEAHSNIVVTMGVGRPSVNVALYSNAINLNEYKLASEAKPVAVVNENASNPVDYEPVSEKFNWSSETFDIGNMNALDADFNFKAKSITFDNITVGEPEVYSYLRNGRLTVNLKNSVVYGGTLKSEIIVDNGSGRPAMKNELSFENIDLSQIPEAVMDDSRISGKASGEIKVYSAGDNQKDIVANLNGNSNIKIIDGSIERVDLFAMAKNVTSAFKIGKTSKGTRFQELSGDFKIVNGLVSNDNLSLKSDVLNFVGAGNVNLNDLVIDYKLTPKYSQDFAVEEQDLLKVPVVISGDLTHPIFRLEVKSIVQDLINNPKAGENLVKQLKRDFKDIKSDFNKNTLKDLKGLFE